MDTRFQIIFNDSASYIQPGIDIIMVSHLTAVDLQTSTRFGQIKFQNNFAKRIKGITISIRCFSQNNIELEGIDPFEYSNMSVPANSVFGSNNTIIFPDQETVYYSIQILKIFFSDDSSFINDSPIDLMMIPEPEEISEKKDYSLYRKALHDYCSQEGIDPEIMKYTTQKSTDIWQCACGRINPSREKRCVVCGASLGDLLLFTNPNYLQQTYEKKFSNKYIQVKQKKESSIEKEIEEIYSRQKADEYRRNGLLAKVEKQKQANMKLIKIATMVSFLGITLVVGALVL